MSAISSPYGLDPVCMVGSRPYSNGITFYRQVSNSANPIFTGTPVSLVSGQVAAITASPTTTAGANTPIGVFVGCEFDDPVTNRRVHSTYLPANAYNTYGASIRIKVVDDPDVVFKVQADGSVAYAALGKNAVLKNFTGSTTTGKSAIQIEASTINTTATFAVRIYGFVEDGNSAPGDSYTDCLVVWNQGVHALRNSTGQ